MTRTRVRLLFLCTCFVLLSSAALGQGRADAPSGITVVLEHAATGKTLTTKTDEKGVFTFTNVEAGSYKLRIGCGVADRGAQKEARECLAEMRIEITDKSTGTITGTIKQDQK